MTAPVPAASDTVWRVIEIDVVVECVRVLGHCDYSTTLLAVILYLRSLVVGKHDCVLPVSEKIYFRCLCLLYKGVGFSLLRRLLGL